MFSRQRARTRQKTSTQTIPHPKVFPRKLGCAERLKHTYELITLITLCLSKPRILRRFIRSSRLSAPGLNNETHPLFREVIVAHQSKKTSQNREMAAEIPYEQLIHYSAENPDRGIKVTDLCPRVPGARLFCENSVEAFVQRHLSGPSNSVLGIISNFRANRDDSFPWSEFKIQTSAN